MANDSIKDERSGFRQWLDRRTGLDSLLHHALDEPIPGGAKVAYVFGSGLLFLFLSQVITGVFLAMYYVPSADHAHTTVAYITKEVTGGSFLRSIHAYGSSAIIIVLLLHLTQTFLYGSYKGRRELVWLAGCVLLTLMLGMAFTGYLLPWDQKAYFATTVGTNILSEVPWVGNALKKLLRGGTEMGTLTLSRFFVFPVFQYLKYWQGSTAVLGILIIPGILGLLLVGLPFFDRSLERRPWKRPLSVGLFTIILLGLGALGFASHREDMRNPGVAAQLKTQREDTLQFMKAKFEPELSGGSLVAQNAALANPEATKGKAIFEREGCNACHGDNGSGTAAAPKLVGIGSKYDAAKLEALLRHPTEKM